jgi:hypothetical protein
MMLFAMSSHSGVFEKNPMSHMGSVQIYYFYDSRIPSAVGETMCGLTEDLLHKHYESLLTNGDIIMYKIDLASQAGQDVAQKCNITLTGLVVARHTRVVNLTQNGYTYARSEPLTFQQNLAFHINRLLPASKRPE